MEGEFCGYIKINFSQGSLGRIEKCEELEDAAIITNGKERPAKKSDVKDVSLFFVSLWLMLSLAGCATQNSIKVSENQSVKAVGSKPESGRIVQPGDVTDIRFFCRLQNGEVVAATDKAVGQQTIMPKSSVFLVRDKDGPLPVTAGVPIKKEPGDKETPFEMEIVDRLVTVVVGMKEGENRTVELKAENLPERSRDNYVLNIARVRERTKELRMTVGDYQARTGKSPETGQPFTYDPAVQGQVEAVTQDEVVILFSAHAGDVVPTPFGPGLIRESEKAYEIEIDAHKGALVRTGQLVGRITDVNEKSIIIDYRNPFGGEPLQCDVAVDKIKEKKDETQRRGDTEKVSAK